MIIQLLKPLHHLEVEVPGGCSELADLFRWTLWMNDWNQHMNNALVTPQKDHNESPVTLVSSDS